MADHHEAAHHVADAIAALMTGGGVVGVLEQPDVIAEPQQVPGRRRPAT
ncbi:hypothetical protein [Dactylosporangium sp. NPDC048998]